MRYWYGIPPTHRTCAARGHIVVGGLGHGQHPRPEVVNIEAVQLQLQGNGPDVRPETDEGVGGGADPIADVLGIGQRR